jgi:hypothetical protein
LTTTTRPRLTITAVLPILLLLTLPLLLLWRVVFLHEVLLPADLLRDIAPWRNPTSTTIVPWVPLQWDGIAEFYPWRLFAAQTLHRGYLPLWNPYQFCGTPFVANSQSAVFYPLNLLFVLLPVPTAFGVSAGLHLMLTGLLMYGFLRSPALGLGRAAATLGAVVWQLSTWQVAWLALPTFLCVSAWLPLALWLTDRLTQRPTLARGAALGACLGVMLLGGHLQIALYGLMLVVTYGLFRAWLRRRDREFVRTLAAGLAALALMIAIAAPQLLPTIELSRMSHRAGTPVDWASYQGYVRLAVPGISLVTLFLPGFFGSPNIGTYWGDGTNGGPSAYMENACYFGVLGLLLAVIGVALTWRARPDTRFFVCAALIALLLALGTPLDALLFFGIPGFAASGSPGRILVLWTFCGAVLAAAGMQALETQWGTVRKTLGGALGAYLLLFVSALTETLVWISHNGPAGVLAQNLGHDGDLWRLPAGILFGAAALYALRLRGTVSPRVFGGALVLLAATDLLAVNLGFNHTTASDAVFPITPAISYLQQHTGDGRMMPLNHAWSLVQPPPAILPPNAATVYGLRDTQGYDSLLTRQSIEWADRLDGASAAPQENGNMVFTGNAASPLASEAAVRYFVSRGPLDSSVPGVRLALQDGETFVYENLSALPRGRTADGETAVTINDSASTRLDFTTAPGTDVTVADQWYPGWQARADGRAIPIREGPDIFRTVTTTKAQTDEQQVHITMRYLPTSFRLGLYGLCVALSVLTALSGRTLLLRR